MKEFAILYKFKKKKPWIGNYELKKYKFNDFIESFCEIHEIPIPKLLVPRTKKKWTKKCFGLCDFKKKTIKISKFSVITLLHELKHWMDHHQDKVFTKKELDERENDAIYFSVSRFYAIWPERIKNLKELSLMNLNEIPLETEDPSMKAIIDIIRGKII